jgi:hypothetical protein
LYSHFAVKFLLILCMKSHILHVFLLQLKKEIKIQRMFYHSKSTIHQLHCAIKTTEYIQSLCSRERETVPLNIISYQWRHGKTSHYGQNWRYWVIDINWKLINYDIDNTCMYIIHVCMYLYSNILNVGW